MDQKNKTWPTLGAQSQLKLVISDLFHHSGLLRLLQWAGRVQLALRSVWRDAHLRKKHALHSKAGRWTRCLKITTKWNLSTKCRQMTWCIFTCERLLPQMLEGGAVLWWEYRSLLRVKELHLLFQWHCNSAKGGSVAAVYWLVSWETMFQI